MEFSFFICRFVLPFNHPDTVNMKLLLLVVLAVSFCVLALAEEESSTLNENPLLRGKYSQQKYV